MTREDGYKLIKWTFSFLILFTLCIIGYLIYASIKAKNESKKVE